MQIIYNGMLGVPASIETGMPDKKLSFYDETNRMKFGKANEYDSFQYAYDAEGGDCTAYFQENQDDVAAENYIPCANMVMEVWYANDDFYAKEKSGVTGPMDYIGAVGSDGWFITKSTLLKEPSLGTHYGMQGEKNRQKLAQIFKRPTTFKEYCILVSTTKCTIPDNTTTRPPAKDGSEDSFSLFRAFTRATFVLLKRMIVTIRNVQVTTWTLHVDGKTISTSRAIISTSPWKAGTMSILKWLSYGMLQIILPGATQECQDNRVTPQKRCDANATEFDLFGVKEGACGTAPIGLKKVSVANMQSTIEEHRDPRMRMSPAYEIYKSFGMTELQQ
ncbi:hypothetical protein ACHAWF_008772 [Thalassiosira exigua]